MDYLLNCCFPVVLKFSVLILLLPLVVTPQQPVVQYGGSAQLNCSLPCAGGTVQWKGLDTNLGSITSFPTHSILHISSAVVAMGGTKICHGTCHGQHYQQAVNLKVYALPDTLQLDTEPHALEPGQPATLHCSAQQVYPLTGLALTWYRGDQALGEADFESVETEEELFDITATLPVAGKDVGEGVEFRCEVTLSIGQETLTRVASVAASAGGECQGRSWGPEITRCPLRWGRPHCSVLLETALLEGEQSPISVLLCQRPVPIPVPIRAAVLLPLPAWGWRVHGVEKEGAIGNNMCQRGPILDPSCGTTYDLLCLQL
uniref:Ig-like domain-containing protein n=1 Tax=Calidris pygmaea TaxID=425635 RepID=A0A8C3K5Q1_9CHAR